MPHFKALTLINDPEEPVRDFHLPIGPWLSYSSCMKTKVRRPAHPTEGCKSPVTKKESLPRLESSLGHIGVTKWVKRRRRASEPEAARLNG